MFRPDEIYEFLRKNREKASRLGEGLFKGLLILLVSYLAASTMTSFSIVFLTKSAMDQKSDEALAAKLSSKDVTPALNYTDLRKEVIDRNIFNSDGAVPEETEGGIAEGQTSTEFNAADVCHKPAAELTLMGTIYMGENGDSLATVREKGYNEADIYKEGDTLLGNDKAIIFDIQPHRVVINNNGVKECLELAASKLAGLNIDSPSGDNSGGGGSGGGGGNEPSHYVLESAFVEESLGPGFAKILEAGRLVPFNKDNQMVGFKLVGVKAGSLWRRIGLNSGDVITKSNDINMAQPEQGFALYQALQESREIRVEYLKRGKDPSTITIEIK